MKTQTYIIKLLDSEGRTVNFERFGHKKLNTCMKYMVEFYKDMYCLNFIKDRLQKSVRLVAHKTDYSATEENKVLDINIGEFMQMIAN